jgi:hypothetical protein
MYIARFLEKDDLIYDLNSNATTLVTLDVDSIEECLPELRRKFKDGLEESLEIKYENIEHISFTHITKENMYDMLDDMEEYEKDAVFISLLEEIDW